MSIRTRNTRIVARVQGHSDFGELAVIAVAGAHVSAGFEVFASVNEIALEEVRQ
jgi:hypothetical protein